MSILDDKLIIAGPCSFASYNELYKNALEIKKLGIKYLRAGAFKMRTNPNSFQGLREEGMEMLLKVKEELGLKIVTEFTTIKQIEDYGDKVDIIQIGSRNMYNYELLKAAGRTKTPVLLKRGFSATYEEWLYAAEYIKNEGNTNIILCERGIRSAITSATRNVLDIQAIPYIKENTDYKIIVDPSHASGLAYMVPSMSIAAIAAGADGLLIEAHYDPSISKSDSAQTIDMNTLKELINTLDR